MNHHLRGFQRFLHHQRNKNPSDVAKCVTRPSAGTDTSTCQGFCNSLAITATMTCINDYISGFEASEGASAIMAPAADQEAPRKQHYEVFVPVVGQIPHFVTLCLIGSHWML